MTTPEPGIDQAAESNSAIAEPKPPVVCDMTGARDTAPQRLTEYARLFQAAYLGRDRDYAGVRWLLRADPGIEELARDLASRENACCAFMTNTVSREGDLVIWHATTIDDQAARAVLDMFYDLPVHRLNGAPEVEDALHRWSAASVPIMMREGDTMRPATTEEIRG